MRQPSRQRPWLLAFQPHEIMSEQATSYHGEFLPDDLGRLSTYLCDCRTLEIRAKNNGLFAASSSQDSTSSSGYQNTWLRDTVLVANYFRESGDLAVAGKTVKTLTNYFCLHRHRFLRIIQRPELRSNPNERPQVRFDGDTLRENPESWSHAQNDALGYALWLPMVMSNAGQYQLDAFDLRAYSLFPAYFEAIQYWQDADSGHWEEEETIHNSSVGVVVGALEQMKRYLEVHGSEFSTEDVPLSVEQLDGLIRKGRERLRTLPLESPPHRMADAALLSLIYPVDAVDRTTADQIIELVVTRLKGEHGIKRYEGDSYWCQDYKKLLPPGELTADFSRRIEERNRLLVPGLEAQWCIFDPILSVIYGRRFLETGCLEDFEQQLQFFRRSLSQLTPEGQCPELYYMANSTTRVYQPNDHTPLAWTQANLGIALHYMRASVSRASANTAVSA